MGISSKRKDKLTMLINNEGVKSFIVLCVALNMALNAIVRVFAVKLMKIVEALLLLVVFGDGGVTHLLLLPQKTGYQLDIHDYGF